MKTKITVGIVALVVLLIIFFMWKEIAVAPVSVRNFTECAAQGYPIIQTEPRECRTPDKQVFIEEDTTLSVKANLIQVDNPKPSQTVSSTLVVSGKARGLWYFEASFPVRLIDANGNTIVQVSAQAQKDWMTENFVPFVARLEFKNPNTKTGALILMKDNPSGLSENADEIRIPVIFKNVDFATTSSTK